MSAIRGFLGIRPGEGRLVALIAALFATVEGARGLAEIAGDTLFVSRYGADSLPYLYIALGLTSLVVALGYGAAIGALPRSTFLPGLLVGFAVILVLERLALLGSVEAVLPGVWLTVQTFNTVLLTFLWTVAGTSLTARQAKRLFPLCTSAAIAGAFLGTLMAGPLAKVFGVENLLLIAPALLGVGAVVTTALTRRQGRARLGRRSTTLAGEVKAGFEYTRRSPLMRLVAIAYVLFAVLFFAISFPFLRALRSAYPNEVDLATTLGLISAAVTLSAFIISIGVANRVYARFGVARAALLLPLAYLAGFGVWLVQFTVATAIAVRVAQQVTQRGISNAAWSALYNVVPVERRPQVLAFIDGVPGQIGTSLSGVLLILGGVLLAPGQVFILGLVAAIACTWVVLQIRGRYGQELVSSLRAGLGEQVLEGGPGLVALGRDPQVMAQLAAALDSPMPVTRRLAADLLGQVADRQARPRLVKALEDPDADVRAAAVGAVERLGGEDVVATVAIALRDPAATVRVAAVRAFTSLGARIGPTDVVALSNDPIPAVRAELAVSLGRIDEKDAARVVLDGLLAGPGPDERLAGLDAAARLVGCAELAIVNASVHDPDPRIRAATVRASAALAMTVPPPADVIAALDDDSALVRSAAADALRTGVLRSKPEAVISVLAVLETGSGRAQNAALAALGDGAIEALDGLHEWALGQLDRATALRRWSGAMRALADDGQQRNGAPSLDFLSFVLSQREREIETRLLTAISILGAPAASGAIRRSLGSGDADVRGQALEALEAIGDRHLAGALARLLEADTTRADQVTDPLRELSADPDVWIRALALRAIAERIDRERGALLELVAGERGPIMDIALAGIMLDGGPVVSKTERTLNEIERMLFLRRVPLFSQLAPEDLQRLAVGASERLYPMGEALVREGEVGDELVVLVEGQVRVVQGEGGDSRFLRTYEAGDHIGELAVLTSRPRAATVIADDQVRGLVIEGATLRAILSERPEAAMAMLATLAERIVAQ